MAFIFIVRSFCHAYDVAIVCCYLSMRDTYLQVLKVFSDSPKKKIAVLLHDGKKYHAILPSSDATKFDEVFREAINVCMHAL